VEHEAPKHRKFAGLPLSVVGPVDLGRLLREIETIDNALLELELRKPGSEAKLPKTSKLMDELVELNKLNLLQAADRADLKKFLEAVKQQAPVLHISFSADPTPSFLQRLMKYIRQEIHPLALVTVGLQPNIGAGCVVRTANKYFDFSLGKRLAGNRELLMSKLREHVTAPAAPAAQGAPHAS